MKESFFKKQLKSKAIIVACSFRWFIVLKQLFAGLL
jgi:hypothetical protein